MLVQKFFHEKVFFDDFVYSVRNGLWVEKFLEGTLPIHEEHGKLFVDLGTYLGNDQIGNA